MIPVGAYNSNYTIVQTADHVMIMSEDGSRREDYPAW